MSDRDLLLELTLREAEVIRLNEIIILLENMSQNRINFIKKCSVAFKKLKAENAELKEKARALEIAEIEVKVLLDELQKIDPLHY